MPFPRDPSQDAFDRMASISLHLNKLMRSAFKEKLRAAGLKPLIKGAAPALIYLRRHGKSILTDIAAGCAQQAAALTWTAKQLEQLKLVVRERDSADKRFYWLELTELGEKYAEIAQATRDDVVRQFFSFMPPAQKARFEELLLRLQEGLLKEP